MIKDEIIYIKGQPKKLVIFLHGYIDSFDSVGKKLEPLVFRMNDIAIHIPKSPIKCEVYHKKYQWYSMHKYDPNDDRKTVKTLNECVDIYTKMHPEIKKANDMINPYIEKTLKKYNLKDKDLYICGYSQGATLALYNAFTREEKIAGVVSFSGMLAPVEYLLNNYKSSPDTLLIHGNIDNQVRFEAMDFSRKNIVKMGSKVYTHAINQGQHKIDDIGIDVAREFINNDFIKNLAI